MGGGMLLVSALTSFGWSLTSLVEPSSRALFSGGSCGSGEEFATLSSDLTLNGGGSGNGIFGIGKSLAV